MPSDLINSDWLSSELGLVKTSLLSIVTPQTILLSDALEYSLSRSGKMLRPQLALICAKLIHCNNLDAVVEASAVAEMIHLATLLHDDVLDDAGLRRGLPTVKQRWGNEIAILSGDYLLAQASLKLSKIGNIRLVEIFSIVLANLCDGEVKQSCSRFQLSIDMENYLLKCQLKTSCLFAAACESAGVLSGCSEPQIVALRDFGTAFGIAFQLVDDLLDFVGDTLTLGKPILGDLTSGLVTAPVIMGLKNEQYGPALKQEINSLFKSVQQGQLPVNQHLIAEMLAESGCFSQSKELAYKTMEKGLKLFPFENNELKLWCEKILAPLDSVI